MTKEQLVQFPAVRDRAIELLETRGWTQGAYARDADGFGSRTLDAGLAKMENPVCFCLAGAVAWAMHERGWTQLTEKLQWFYTHWFLGNPGYDSRRWFLDLWANLNDGPKQTKEGVIETLKAMEFKGEVWCNYENL